MIKINGKKYECMDFVYHKIVNVEHLSIVIKGELDSSNKIIIEYKDEKYYGYKILPKLIDGITSFMVYIFQIGDRELLS